MTHRNYSTQFLGETVAVTIDRPLGSAHPNGGFLYPVNYGYVDGVIAPDGDYLDAYVLGIDKPVHSCSGVCVAVIQRLDDEDDKLVVVVDGRTYSDYDIRELTHFQERFFQSIIIRR